MNVVSKKSILQPNLTTRIKYRIESAVRSTVFLWPMSVGKRSDRHVLLAPPGAGNIGDTALVEAFIEVVGDRVVVVVRQDTDFPNLTGVEILVLSDLLYGSFWGHVRDSRRLRSLLSSAASFSVVGADIMDGAYNERASVRRSNLARLAQRVLPQARILGFSWNARPSTLARKSLVKAARSGVATYLRDPVSLQRALGDGVTTAGLAADIVFAAHSVVSLPDADLERFALANPVAIVNVSGLIARETDQTGSFTTIVEYLHELGYGVVLLPHVSRPKNDDVAACRAVYETVDQSKTYMVETLLRPQEVRGLAARAKLVVTGRMHLAILALSSGVPAISLSTQGKVEGLLSLFARPEWCVEPIPGFESAVIAAISKIDSGPDMVRQDLAEALPAVVSSARQNFSGLESGTG